MPTRAILNKCWSKLSEMKSIYRGMNSWASKIQAPSKKQNELRKRNWRSVQIWRALRREQSFTLEFLKTRNRKRARAIFLSGVAPNCSRPLLIHKWSLVSVVSTVSRCRARIVICPLEEGAHSRSANTRARSCSAGANPWRPSFFFSSACLPILWLAFLHGIVRDSWG